ncbi:MAG TPA: hypothetical protein VD994_13095, partial [Prosthecobacter sp.]|nr:hypothetical protein [Prosthecobacter sp.]
IGAPSDVNLGAGLQQAVNRPAKSDLEGQIASLQAQQPGRASQIPTPREQVGGYLGGVVGNMPQPSSFPGRPMEMAGAFPAQRGSTNFPGRPGEMQGAFPAEDAQPSTFPGRPMEMAGAFPASRTTQVPGMAKYGLSPYQGSESAAMVAASVERARKEQAALDQAKMQGRNPFDVQKTDNSAALAQIAKEAEDNRRRTEIASAMQGGLPNLMNNIRATPPSTNVLDLTKPYDPLSSIRSPSRVQSMVAGRPEFPGAFPAEDASPSTFPGRPEFRGPGFPAAPQMASTFPGRPEFPGAFPAAKSYENPARSFAGIPSSGFPQQPATGGGFFAGLGDIVNKGKAAVSGVVDATKPVAQLAWDNLNNPLLGLVRPADPRDPNRTNNADRPVQWTGNEPPEQVAAMQQEVEEVLRGYFVQVTGQQYPQYTTGYFPVEGTA